MSGGVDSSVAALLMKNEGYQCVGATMQLYIEGDCSDAKAVADKLGMPFYIFPFKPLSALFCPFLPLSALWYQAQ